MFSLQYRTMNKKFRTFCQRGCQNCILHVHRYFVRKIADLKTFFTIFGHRSEKSWQLFRNYPAVLSKMRSTCSKQIAWGQKLFWKKMFLIICGLLWRKFWQIVEKNSVGLSKLHSSCPWKIMRENVSFERLIIYDNFSKFEWSFLALPLKNFWKLSKLHWTCP